MGLRRTLSLIVSSPERSPGWKIFDVTLLIVLWSATVGVLVAVLVAGLQYQGFYQYNQGWYGWSLVFRVLFPLTLLATASSWYRHPKLGKRARAWAEQTKKKDDTPPTETWWGFDVHRQADGTVWDPTTTRTAPSAPSAGQPTRYGAPHPYRPPD